MKINVFFLSPAARSKYHPEDRLPTVEMLPVDVNDEFLRGDLGSHFTRAIQHIREVGFRPTENSWVSPSAIIRIEVAE